LSIIYEGNPLTPLQL